MKPIDLNGKHVAITGASSGLGEALALEMAPQGARVTLSARRYARLEAVVQQITAAGGKSQAFAADVTVQDSVSSALAQAVEQWGPVDILVANAGVSPTMTAAEFDVSLVEDTMQLNFFGVVYSMNAVLPSMIERGSGVVLAISSVAAFRGLPTMGPYCASKAAVSAWMESLRSELDLKKTGVRLITSHPGYIKTPMTESEDADMPFLVEADEAARILVRGIVEGASEINFPWQFLAMMKLARRLPNRIYDRVVWGSKTNPVTWGLAARDACLWVIGGLAVCLFAWASLDAVSTPAAATLRATYRFALPLMAGAALVASGKLRSSAKVPVFILVISIPLAIFAGLVRMFGIWSP